MRKIFILVNPVSGRHKSGKALLQLREALENAGLTYECFQTKPDCNGRQTVEQNLDRSFTDLVILGGDGTLNEAINGLKLNIPVGIIPTGSGNDYVKMLDLGDRLDKQIQTAIYGEIKSVDLGLCNGRKFLNGVGIGFDGQIVADLIHEKTWIKGAAKYYYHVLKILGSYKPRPFTFSVDGVTQNKDLILLCVAKGTTFGGSFKLTPQARLDSGQLRICEVGPLSPLKRFLNIPSLFAGKHEKLNEVNLYEAQRIRIETNPQLEAHIDGEYAGNPPFEIRILEGGLKVRACADI